jgi:hypothetical protein
VSQRPEGEDRIPLTRLALWALLGILLIAGLVLFFLNFRRIEPIIGGPPAP